MAVDELHQSRHFESAPDAQFRRHQRTANQRVRRAEHGRNRAGRHYAGIRHQGFLWNRDNNNFRPRIGLAWSINEDTVVRAGFAAMTLDWNLGWTNQSEIGGSSFLNQSVSQPANVYTPLFNINAGVPAFVSVKALPDGSIPTGASSPSARPTITVVPSNYHNPYTLTWKLSVQ